MTLQTFMLAVGFFDMPFIVGFLGLVFSQIIFQRPERKRFLYHAVWLSALLAITEILKLGALIFNHQPTSGVSWLTAILFVLAFFSYSKEYGQLTSETPLSKDS